MRKDILERKDDILKWISENKSKQFICKELSCKYTTLNHYLSKFGIKYDGNKPSKGYSKSKKKVPIEVFLNNEKQIKSYTLKNRLIEEHLKEMKCENCGLDIWQGVPIPLELHHIDGNHFNNSLNNLKLLCPNCHALTDNYRGRATIKHKEEQETKIKPINKKEVNNNYCIDCGKLISRKAIRCKSCSGRLKNKRCERPSRDFLKELIRNNSFVKIGERFGVTDNTIRKWCKSFKLPFKTSDIKKYSDDEWQRI